MFKNGSSNNLNTRSFDKYFVGLYTYRRIISASINKIAAIISKFNLSINVYTYIFYFILFISLLDDNRAIKPNIRAVSHSFHPFIISVDTYLTCIS